MVWLKFILEKLRLNLQLWPPLISDNLSLTVTNTKSFQVKSLYMYVEPLVSDHLCSKLNVSYFQTSML